jgi:hypothetical protein
LGTSTMKCMETFGDHQFVFSVETALAYWTFFFVRWRHIWIWKMKDIPSRTFFSMRMKKMSIWSKNVMRYAHILRQVGTANNKLKCLNFLFFCLTFLL